MSDDAFCILPWTHVEVVPEGAAKICCVAREAIRDGKTPMNVATHSLDQIRNSRYLQSVRKALADGRRIPVCTYCWDQEKRGERSQREFWNGLHAESTARVREKLVAGGDPAEPEPLEYLQISVGNKCNLACRMCNAAYSSRIEEDPVHVKWAPRQDREREVWTEGGDGKAHPAATRPDWAPNTPWFEQPAFIDQDLMSAGASLTSLYVTGGEPLMIPSFDRLLDEYVSRGYAQHMTLTLNTNLFHNEARLAKALESFLRFEKIHLAPSIDGYGAVYEYIRYPAKWAIVDRNIRTVAQARRHPHFSLVLTTVAQAYNIFNLVDLLRYADELQVECHPHMLDGPAQLRAHVLPRALRLRAAEALDAYARTPGDSVMRTANRAHAARIARFLEAIEDDAHLDALQNAFAAFTRDLDASRNQSLAASVPELAEFLAGLSSKPATAARRWWPFRSA